MIKVIKGACIFMLMFMVSCSTVQEKTKDVASDQKVEELSPNEMLTQAYQFFKEGNDSASIRLANRVLEIGRETKNDTLVGRALTSLCRNSQRQLDTTRLAELSAQLSDLAATSGNQKWLMYRAHMNAEMWRLIGNMDRAEAFYNESMKISYATNSMGMYTIDHFNKSLVSTAKGDFETASELIKKYYQLRFEADSTSEDAYGLIALAYLLEQQGNYEGAHEVAVATRKLFEQQNLFPEPPDEKPLLMVESSVKEKLDPFTYHADSMSGASATVPVLLGKYLGFSE